jgi:tetracycline resistance efflux pump
VWHEPLKTLWPVVVALAVVLITRRALWGLLTGAFAGALILCHWNPWEAYLDLFSRHLAPSLQSSWKVGAILFTLILGGFAAVLHSGGGFQSLLRLLVRRGGNTSRRFQAAATGLGLVCFFDGLANSMVVGRVCKDMAKRCGVSLPKLAYIADSTSSAVACVAFVSTWIAYQLTMIREGYAMAGREINPYWIFVQSIPFNFYCWFTLVMLFVSIFRRFNPGPMKDFETDVLSQETSVEATSAETREEAVSIHSVGIPLVTLILSFLLGFYILGCPESLWPVTIGKIAAAFGSDAGPLVLVLSGLMASLVAVLLFPSREGGRFIRAVDAFQQGVRSLLAPVLILIAAWMIGSVLGALKTAEYLSSLVTETNVAALIPSLIFVTGSLISFSTGTSWGTMGILFPLAIPIAASVFGDHCSPFSDTTIVSSISCGVEPHDHIRTQLPFALLTAIVTILFGFLPAGWGVPPYVSLAAGALCLIFLPNAFRGWRNRSVA